MIQKSGSSNAFGIVKGASASGAITAVTSITFATNSTTLTGATDGVLVVQKNDGSAGVTFNCATNGICKIYAVDGTTAGTLSFGATTRLSAPADGQLLVAKAAGTGVVLDGVTSNTLNIFASNGTGVANTIMSGRLTIGPTGSNATLSFLRTAGSVAAVLQGNASNGSLSLLAFNESTYGTLMLNQTIGQSGSNIQWIMAGGSTTGLSSHIYGWSAQASNITTSPTRDTGLERIGAAIVAPTNGAGGAGDFQLIGQKLTTGTMTATSTGLVKTTLSRFDWTNAMVTALGATTAGDITICTLPAKTVVTNAYMVVDTAAGTVTTLTGAVGRVSATYIDYIVASDLKAAANTVYGDASAERGTNLTGYDLPSYTGTTAVVMHLISTGGNLSTVTTCTGHIYLETMVLP